MTRPFTHLRQAARSSGRELSKVFHLLVIARVSAHFLAISLFALPTG